eukprot:s2733_g5.t1
MTVGAARRLKGAYKAPHLSCFALQPSSLNPNPKVRFSVLMACCLSTVPSRRFRSNWRRNRLRGHRLPVGDARRADGRRGIRGSEGVDIANWGIDEMNSMMEKLTVF